MVIASLGEPSGKPRPHVILRGNRFAAHRLVALLAFTTTLTEASSLRIGIEPTPENGLREASQAMIDHIRTMRVERIRQVIGRLSDAEMQAITRALAVYLGFAD